MYRAKSPKANCFFLLKKNKLVHILLVYSLQIPPFIKILYHKDDFKSRF